MQTSAAIFCIIAVILTIYLVFIASRRTAKVPKNYGSEGPRQSTSILLKDGMVVDFSEDASDMYDGPDLVGANWPFLRGLLASRFPNLPDALPDSSQSFTATDCSGTLLSLEPRGDVTRVNLSLQNMSPALAHRLFVGLKEKESYKSILEAMPDPAVRCDVNGDVTWYNAPYLKLCRDFGQRPETFKPFNISKVQYDTPHKARACVEENGMVRWLEVFSTPDNDGNVLLFAKKIDTLIDAEIAQRNFIQTLTKTFAHLPIGLAVFDRNRQLVLFNPALVDLTNLPSEFLSSRPNLLSFFDHLRENRMIPEPKDYQTWRAQLADVIAAAKNDRYSETWNLPSGLTYKITGRPHPDGAVAFLIEDISAEISLTRRFRSELELSRSVIDTLDDAVAVFSQLGVMTFCNNAYRSMWSFDEDNAYAETSITDATVLWAAECEPCPIWPELREYVTRLTDRAPWDATLVRRDDRRIACRIEPVAAGSTLIRFHTESVVTHPNAAPCMSEAITAS